MKKTVLSLLVAAAVAPSAYAADNITEALTSGKANVDVLMRYEGIDRDTADPENIVVDAEAIVLRTRIGYHTGSLSGFSAYAEIEDSRTMFGLDEVGLPPTQKVADPEVTEVDQAFVQYKNDIVTAKVGRQVITNDEHRFIGHVGWRQDRQTFDAARVELTPVENLKIDLSYVWKHNRIFAELADADADNTFLHISYKTPVGTVAGYSYLIDDETRNVQVDTYGVRFKGSTKLDSISLHYHAEYATQDLTFAAGEFEPEYLFLEGGLTVAGITGKIGYEVLGSDDGLASFSTPLSTLHKWNGWADVFVGPTFNPAGMPGGLVDNYLSIAGKAGPINLSVTYHVFESDEESIDYGDEVDFSATTKFGKIYNAGLKYASYSADDRAPRFVSTDTEVTWAWFGFSF